MIENLRHEVREYLEKFENCLERETPYCEAACPFGLPVFNFMEKAQRGAFTAAFKVYRDAAGFPRIASSLCGAPCKGVCPRADFGGAVEINALEKAAIQLAGNTSAVDYNIPAKKERVAIVGAGLSGMAACLRLSTKKYRVDVFEKADRIGGQLWELLPSDVFLKEIEEQLAYQEYALHLNTKISDISALAADGFDAVYVATGKNGEDFGLLCAKGDANDSYCMRVGGAGIFAGGSLTGKEPVYSLADGLCAGTVIDNFLKTGKLYYPKNERKTRMCAGMAVPEKTVSAIRPSGEDGYTKEEASAEAGRCIKCKCRTCRVHCDLVAFSDKWPVRIRDEIVATTLEGKSELKATPAKRLMSLCNQCGLCKEVCPEGIDMDGLFLAGRAAMHRQGKTPWPFYDFWLRDMKHANEYGLTRPAPGGKTCRYAFFPGCQIGADEPELTEKTYARLLAIHPDTGLILRCCGVPLEWAGREEEFLASLSEIRTDWETLGKPVLILACPNCVKKFREYLPEIPLISLYEVLAAETDTTAGQSVQGDGGLKSPSRAKADSRNGYAGCGEEYVYPPETRWAVFDACPSRHDEGVKTAVRKLSEAAGYSLVPLSENEAYGKCCGHGGHGAIANPDYQAFVADRRAAESEAPYITYCINCRDVFLNRGKKSAHILELLMGDGNLREKTPPITLRRENRVRLKQALAKYWGEEMKSEKRRFDIEVRMDGAVLEKLNREMILEEDAVHTVDFCQRHGRRVFDAETNTYSGYCTVGHSTYWVEYRQLGEKSFELLNAYSHRMKIELEAVWNGKKQDLDLR